MKEILRSEPNNSIANRLKINKINNCSDCESSEMKLPEWVGSCATAYSLQSLPVNESVPTERKWIILRRDRQLAGKCEKLNIKPKMYTKKCFKQASLPLGWFQLLSALKFTRLRMKITVGSWWAIARSCQYFMTGSTAYH